MDFLFSSMVDVEFDKALDAAFERLDKMPADAFVQQALMRSGGPIAGLSAAAVEGPAMKSSLVYVYVTLTNMSPNDSPNGEPSVRENKYRSTEIW